MPNFDNRFLSDCSPYVILFLVLEKEERESNVGKIKDCDSPQIDKEIRDEVRRSEFHYLIFSDILRNIDAG